MTAVARRPAIFSSTTIDSAPTVLLLGGYNTGRSRIAAGWLRDLAGDRVSVLSSGSEPAVRINPVAVDALADVGMDMTAHKPASGTSTGR